MKIQTTFALSILLLFGVGTPAKSLAQTPATPELELANNQFMLSAQTTHHGSHSPWQGSPRRGFADAINTSSPSDAIAPHRGSGR